MVDQKDIAEALQRPGALPAFLTALGILGFLVAQNVAYRLIHDVLQASYGGSPGADFGTAWATELASVLGGPLFFALGVFLCLWQLAPIASTLRLAHVVTRALLAAVIGAGCYWIFQFISTLVLLAVNGLFQPAGDVIAGSAFDALMESLRAIVEWLPLVVLGAVLLWGWLQRHPSTQAVRGAVDEA